MKREENSDLLKARRNRARASAHAEMLLLGFAESLKRGYIETVEDLAPYVDQLNGPITEAVHAMEKADEEYLKVAPKRRRIARFRPRRRVA